MKKVISVEMSCFGIEETKILFSGHYLSIILVSRFKIDNVPKKHLCTQNLLTESLFDFFKGQLEELNYTTQEISFLPIFAVDINFAKEISNLKSEKAVRSNDIPTKIIKDFKDLFATFIYNNYNKCLLDGAFPEDLKTAKVVPVHKNHNRQKSLQACKHFIKYFKNL